jgi:hypothetical protein
MSVGRSIYPSVHLELSDAAYTERLASFLASLGQEAVVAGPGHIDVLLSDDPGSDVGRRELEIYLRVWSVLYPEAQVTTDER